MDKSIFVVKSFPNYFVPVSTFVLKIMATLLGELPQPYINRLNHCWFIKKFYYKRYSLYYTESYRYIDQ